MSATLLTFSPMIDSELARLLLDHYALPFVEQPHIFAWGSAIAILRGGSGQVPLLVNGSARCSGPHAMVDSLDPQCAAGRRLIPADGMLASEVAADWDRFNGVLGDAVAAWCYHHLLPQRAIMVEPLARGLPAGEARAWPTVYPAVAGLLRTLLGLNAAKAASAREVIDVVFAEVAQRLADGRRYLVGDTLTLSDFALAASAAPVLMPAGLRSPLPALDLQPEVLRETVRALRATPAGQFVVRLYAEWGVSSAASTR